MGVGRRVKDQVKHGKGFDSGDARHVNSGQSRVQNAQIRLAYEQMADPTYNAEYARKFGVLRLKRAKAVNPERIKEIEAQMRALAKQFIGEGWLH